MNNFKSLFIASLMVVLMSGCDTSAVVDTNMSMPSRNWAYPNKVKVVVDIKDNSQSFNIYFKLRHTTDYRYSNIFILFKLSGNAQKARTRRYEYTLAQPDGQWLGSGSGNLYSYTFPLLTNYKFPAPGKYELEIEQNMRDNPLGEISDAGIMVAKRVAN